MPERPLADPEAELAAIGEGPVRRPSWGIPMLAVFIGLVVCTNIANIVWSTWIDDDPEAVIALSSRNRYLALAVGSGISLPAFVAIAAARLGVAFAVCHMLGRAFRQDAYRFFTKYLGMTTSNVRQLEDGFGTAQWVLVPFFIGSNIVAVITGVERVPWPRLVVLFFVGLAGRLALIWWLAKAFEEQLEDVLGFIARYQWWVLAASILLVVVVNGRNVRRGRTGGAR